MLGFVRGQFAKSHLAKGRFIQSLFDITPKVMKDLYEMFCK